MSLPSLRATCLRSWPERERVGRDLAHRLAQRTIVLPAWLPRAEVDSIADTLFVFLDAPVAILSAAQLAGAVQTPALALLPGEQGEVAAPPSSVVLSQLPRQPGQRRLDLPPEIVWLRDAVIDCVGLHFNGQRMRDVAGWTRRVADTPASALAFLDAAQSILLQRPHITDRELFALSLAALLHELMSHVEPLVAQWVLALASKATAPERLVGTNAALLGLEAARRRAFEAGLIRVLPAEDGAALHWRQPLGALASLADAPGKPSLAAVMEALASLATGPERAIAQRLSATHPPALPMAFFSPSPYFSGRDEILQRLAALLDPSDTIRACVLHGAAGIGKTEVAAALCQRLSSRFEPVWLSSSSPEQGWSSVAIALEIDMTLPARPGDPVPGWVRAAQERLKDDHYLLIVEAERWGEESLAPWLPSGRGSCAILALSRGPLRELEHTHDAIHLRLGPLPLGEARALLSRHLPRLSDEIARGEADRLIERLGNHPAALSLIAPRLKAQGFEETLRWLSGSPTGEAGLDHLLRVILDDLPPEELSSLRDIDTCDASGAPLELLAAMSDAPDPRAVLDRLSERSLITRGPQLISSHPIVRLALHQQPEPEGEQATRLIRHAKAILELFKQAQASDHHAQQDLLFPDLKLALGRASSLLATREPSLADLVVSLADVATDYPRGNAPETLFQAIEAYRVVLEVRTRERFPEDWAKIQNNLGVALANLPTGARADNLRQAIEAYRAALAVRTREHFPINWAMTQNNLGVALANLPTGDRSDNLRQAIEAYRAALEVHTREHFPEDWATTQNNLGVALTRLPTGDRSDNLRQAVEAYRAALAVCTRERYPRDWAKIQLNLGVALAELPTGDRSDNLRQAIEAYRAALEVHTREHFPEDWAKIENNLGVTLTELPTGDRADNLRQAVEAYRAALEVRTREHFPINWAMTQNNLGVALANLPTGDRADNLRQAIEAYRVALEIFEPESFPEDHLRSSQSLKQAQEALEEIRKGQGDAGPGASSAPGSGAG